MNPIHTECNQAKRPEDLRIVARKVKCDYRAPMHAHRFWYGNEIGATHFFNAFQSMFPEGERLFIEAALDGAAELERKGALDPQLAADIKLFIKQEGHHALQHARWNQALIQEGYDRIADYVEQMRVFRTRLRRHVPATLRLSITAAAEHYTASLVYVLLSAGSTFISKAIEPFKAELLYHAMEEVEHKAVCFQAYMCRSGSYLGRMVGFLFATLVIAVRFYSRFRYLLQRDGAWSAARRRTFSGFFLGKNGMVRKLLPRVLKYLKPSFSPWQTDERAFVKRRFQEIYAGIQNGEFVIE